MIRRPPRSPLFPYTPLSRSEHTANRLDEPVGQRVGRPHPPRVPEIAEPAGEHAHDERVLAGWFGYFRNARWVRPRSEEHTSELQSQSNLVCRLLLEKKKKHD